MKTRCILFAVLAVAFLHVPGCCCILSSRLISGRIESRFPMPQANGSFSLIEVKDGVLYYNVLPEALFAVDIKTHEILWKYLPEITSKKMFFDFANHFEVFEGTVYCSNWNGVIWAIDASSGELKWKREFSEGIRHPAFSHGSVFVPCDEKRICVLDIETGAVKLEFDLPVPFVTQIKYDDDTLFFGGNDSVFYAVSTDGLKTRWTFRAENSILEKIVTADEMIFFATSLDDLYCIGMKTGRKHWEYVVAGGVCDFAYRNGELYVTGMSDSLDVLKCASGKVLWEYELISQRYGTLILPSDKNVLLMKYEYGIWFMFMGDFETIDSSSRSYVWEKTINCLGKPVIVGERVYYVDLFECVIFGLDLGTGECVWELFYIKLLEGTPEPIPDTAAETPRE